MNLEVESGVFQYPAFHIHGDNIVECERTFDLFLRALDHLDLVVSGPTGSPVCPEYRLAAENQEAKITFYPGFGRWNEDVLENVRARGGTLREAADAIVTGVLDGKEEPLIAIEFCGALPAGNQAWQRSGRAYSFGKSDVPYLYVAELGGYELGQDRVKKAARMPNPVVPFSYLTYSMNEEIPVLPIFITAPGADTSSRTLHADEFADRELVDFVRSILIFSDPGDLRERLQLKVLSLVKKRAQAARANRTMSAQQWESAYRAVESDESIVDYMVREPALPWSKTAYIAALTDSARTLMKISGELGIGLTSVDLPMCIIRQSVRKTYAKRLVELYGDLPCAFVSWLERDSNLVICWVMGFKPRGDDARPDRGLPPLTRMLVGKDQDILTVVYGPAPKSTWPILVDNPAALAKRNGLWESILEVSDAILVDSSTDSQTHHGFIRDHWVEELPKLTVNPFYVSPKPTKIGENDVDTVLHTLMAKLASSDDVFEGMCNPPGGDWSGVSFLTPNRNIELRWISLPRVSGKGTKRPDHVFQLFNVLPKPVILCVESKELPRAVEDHIGPHVIAYVAKLLESPASIERKSPANIWGHSEQRLRPDDFLMASGVAFISSSVSDIKDVQRRSQADLLFCFEFLSGGDNCTLRLLPSNETGEVIADYLCSVDLSMSQTSVERLP